MVSAERGNEEAGWSVAAITRSYIQRLNELLRGIDEKAVEEAVMLLRRGRESGATIFIAGNGGSAATAAHLVNDLGKATKRSGQRPLRVMGLSDNVPWLTALANDEGYDRVFAGQLENFARPGDVLLLISASGNSPNLLEAVRLAAHRGVNTIALVGFDGGRLRSLVDCCVWVESEQGLYGPVETAHVVIGDILTTALMEDRVSSGKMESHDP